MNTPQTHNQQFRTVPPPVSHVSSMSLPDLRIRTLDNGVTLRIYDKCNSDVCYLSIVTNGGEAESGSPAIAALASIMQREGSSAYNGEQISAIMDYNGSWLKNTPLPHNIQHAMFSLNSRLHQVLPVFYDLVFNPSFPETPFAVRREALARNLEVSATDVSYIARCESDRLIMGTAHPLAKTDTPDTVRSISTDTIKAFASHAISPDRASIYLCGNITAEIEQIVADTFGAPFHESIATVPEPYTTPFSPGVEKAITRIHRPEALQTAICLTLPAIPRTHPHYLPLHMTVMALGGYFGSRLMLNIREEKGLTYGISSSLIGYPDGAFTLISCETDNANTERLIEEIRSELIRLATDPCQGNELMRLKQSATSQMASILDSPFSIMDYHITMHTTGIPQGYFNSKLQTINSLTPDIISRMAEIYLNPDNLRIAMAGNMNCI